MSGESNVLTIEDLKECEKLYGTNNPKFCALMLGKFGVGK